MKKDSATIGKCNAVRPVTPEEVYGNKGLIMDVGRDLGWDFSSCEDLVQEVALKCWRNSKMVYDPSKGSLEGYISRVARNTAVDIWRKNRHNPVTVDDIELLKILEAVESYTDDTVELEKRLALLDRGIGELYRRYSKEGNDAFVMFSRKGMRANEVARKLGVGESFVNVAVHRGMKRLKDIVRRLEREDLGMPKAS